MSGPVTQAIVGKPEVEDAQAIHDLIALYARERLLLPRPLNNIYESLRDFTVCRAEGSVVGCGALHLWSDLAEIRSLAVAEEWRGRGLGRRIVEACLAEARRLHVREVFALTFQPDFFRKMGFAEVPKERFPHKIWNECVKCPHFPNCGEVALALELRR